ncbi:MAG: hypothetical protein VXW74_00450, partial [Candidatus Thermoplasmatota archaeon]|nr:hypothetical protein [Candidatus Thermoplasmatota archaeon]
MSIGGGVAGVVEPPSNGLLVEGSVGIGTEVPASTLDISGGVSIGHGFAGSVHATSGNVLMEGGLGVGTASVMNRVDVEGGLAVGSGYSGGAQAPTDGMIVEGAVGIGTAHPATSLHVVSLEDRKKEDEVVEMLRLEREVTDASHNSARAEGGYIGLSLSDVEMSWNHFPMGLLAGMDFVFSGHHGVSGVRESIEFLGEDGAVIFRLELDQTSGSVRRSSVVSGVESAVESDGGYPFVPDELYTIHVLVVPSGFDVTVDAVPGHRWTMPSTYEGPIGEVRSIRVPEVMVGSWSN